MKYSDFHDDGDSMAVYFILDQSRNQPAYERANLMLSAKSFLAHPSISEASDELYWLANELFDCEQDVQRLIGILRCDNAPALAESTALEFLVVRLEKSDLRTKIDLTGNHMNMGLRAADGMAFHNAWVKAYARVNAFEQRLDLFMFRLRTHHWRISNAETLAEWKKDESSKPLVAAAS